MSQSFATLYAQLNPNQRRAVDTIEGPLMVIAGPGTGKTHVLTMRIASILAKTDTPPAGILALTFTDAAAVEMKERLEKIIGRDAYYVTIATFHSFCSSIISMHPEYFSFDMQGVVVSEIEQLQLIREILNELDLEELKPKLAFDYWSTHLRSHISQFKREGVTAGEFSRLVAEESEGVGEALVLAQQKSELTDPALKRQKKLLEIASVYSSYEERLKQSGRFDYDDLIMSVREALVRNPDLLSTIQEQYLYILVDEYQDTNSAQNEIVKSVSSFWGDQANICVVGDPHQSIFRFQGASMVNTINFFHWFPAAELITLTTGYRCTPAMYQLAHRSITQSPQLGLEAISPDNQVKITSALSEPLQSIQQQVSTVPFVVAQTREQQSACVVQAVADLLAQGTAPNNIALLVKTNQDVLDIASYLESEGIAHRVSTVRDALTAPVVRQLLSLIELCIMARTGTEVSEQLFDVLCLPWLKLDTFTVFSLARHAGRVHQSLWEVCQVAQRVNQEQQLQLAPSSLQAIEQQVSTIIEWSTLESHQSLEQWLRHVLQHSGLLELLLDSNQLTFQTDQLIALKAFIEWIRSLTESRKEQLRAVDLLALIDTMRSQGFAVPMLEQPDQNGVVTISTVHKAKGMEWEHVFVMDLVDKKWGNAPVRSSLPVPNGLLMVGEAGGEALSESDRLTQDDRRLFYVAVTRAKKSLTLYAYAYNNQGGKVKKILPSIFISELMESVPTDSTTPLLFREEVPPSEEIQKVELTHSIGPRQTIVTDQLYAYVTQILATFSLSITSLNNYLIDPKLFLIRNLLQLPSEKSPPLVLGTIVHESVKQLFEARVAGQQLDTAGLTTAAKKKILAQLSHRTDAHRWASHAQQVIDLYVEESNQDDISGINRLEYAIGAGKRSAFIDGIALKGRLDRLDWSNSENKSFVVIDYKSGNPKTVGDILASTPTAKKKLSERELALPTELQGAYYRQLVFYSLLASLDRSLRWPITEGVFDFVESPLRKGKRILRHFPIPSTDVELLKEVIVHTMKEIRSLSFIEDIMKENDLARYYLQEQAGNEELSFSLPESKQK